MTITLTIWEIAIILLGTALFILLLYTISLIRTLIPSIKKLQNVMSDIEKLSGTAVSATEEAQDIVQNISASTKSLADNLKGNQNTIAALTSIVNSLISIKNLFSKQN